MKSEILKLLRESGESISGQELCQRFQVSRTAVWKAVNQLKKEGYQIEAVQNKGYRLVDMPDVLSKNELSSRIQTKWAGKEIYYFEETTSSNIEAKRLAEEGAPHGTLVVAEKQTAGRGRRGRQWDSPAGKNIYFTILLRPQIKPDKASMLTLVMAHSVQRAITEIVGENVKIKWPNDVVMNGKKICGILTEMTMDLEQPEISSVIIGTGINVGNEDFDKELREKATSLFLETGKKWKRAQIIEAVMNCFEEDYQKVIQAESLAPILDEYNQRLVNKDAIVRVLEPGNEYVALAKGINKEGHLLVEKEDGKLTEVYAGEVSVRGIYGYTI